VRIRTPYGDYYPDNLWAEQRLIGEADGEAKYAEAARVTQEKLRDGYLRDEGYELIHWTGKEMFGAAARVTERVARLLLARGWDGQPVRW
jgi:very-short-patch-repair endonuclease